MRLKLGPACNTPTATNNLLTLHWGFILMCPHFPLLVATLMQAWITPRNSIYPTPKCGKCFWQGERKERALVITRLQESGDEWWEVQTLFLTPFISGAPQAFTKPHILSLLFPLPTLSLSSNSLGLFSIKFCLELFCIGYWYRNEFDETIYFRKSVEFRKCLRRSARAMSSFKFQTHFMPND